MMIVCYCCGETIKDEKEFYSLSVKLLEIVEERVCRKISSWLFDEMKFCSVGCIIVELAKRIK